MRKLSIVLVSVFLVAVVLNIFTPGAISEAKEPLGQVMISGAGLRGNVEVTSGRLLERLGIGQLENFDVGKVDAPDVAGAGFGVARSTVDDDGNFVLLDKQIYYPDAAGGIGYLQVVEINYEDGFGGDGIVAGDWFEVRPDAERILQETLIMYGAQLVQVTREGAELPTSCSVADVAYMAVEFVDAVDQSDEMRLDAFLQDDFVQYQADDGPAYTNATDALNTLDGVRGRGEAWYIREIAVGSRVVGDHVDVEFLLMRGPIGTRIYNEKFSAKEMFSMGQATFACDTQTLVAWTIGDLVTDDKTEDLSGTLCPAVVGSQIPVVACAYGDKRFE